MNKLLPFTEVVGAIHTPTLSNEQITAFKTDAKDFLKVNLDIKTASDINVVENSTTEVHLALPYYAIIDDMQAEMLKDESLNNIAGGEILISIFALGGAGVGIGIALAAGTIGPSTVAIVGATAAVGGVIGAVVTGTVIHASRNAVHSKDFSGNKK